MVLQFTARHFQASESLKENSTEQLKELTKYYENIISAHMILDVESEKRKTAEIIVGTKHKSITGKGTDEKMGVAIDSALTKVERQLKKQSEKLKEHKDKGNKRIINKIDPVEDY